MTEKELTPDPAPRDLERHIGQTVRKLRLQQNLTIAEIARKAGISSGMLSKIENGQTSASLDSLAGLADALGTTLASVFSGYSSDEGGAQHIKAGQGPEVVRRGTKRGHTYQLLSIERGPRDSRARAPLVSARRAASVGWTSAVPRNLPAARVGRLCSHELFDRR